ncbi:MAG TPA: hypothetical protein DDZ70_03550, partial [Firmicutes bacterium]|nr:hypothetical protein [Bacillota bacterium]
IFRLAKWAQKYRSKQPSKAANCGSLQVMQVLNKINTGIPVRMPVEAYSIHERLLDTAQQ